MDHIPGAVPAGGGFLTGFWSFFWPGGCLRRLRLARSAAASFSGEDLAMSALVKALKENLESPAFLRGIHRL